MTGVFWLLSSFLGSAVSSFKDELGWTDDWIMTYKIITESTCNIEGSSSTAQVAASSGPGTEIPISGASMFKLGEFEPIYASSSVILFGTYNEIGKLPVLGVLKVTGNCEAVSETGCTSWELCMKESRGDELCDEYKFNKAAASTGVLPIVYSLSPATPKGPICGGLSMLRSMVQQRVGQDMNWYCKKMHEEVLPVSEPRSAEAISSELEVKIIWRNFFKTSVSVCIAVVQALQKLHAAGIIHGDVHQGNVAFSIQRTHFTNMGELKLDDIRLVDLGLARFYPLELGVNFRDMDKENLFTKTVLSPWHIAGFRIGRRDDVYRAMEVLGNVLTNLRLETEYEEIFKRGKKISGFKIDEAFLNGSTQISLNAENLANFKRFGPLFTIKDCKKCGFDKSVGLEITQSLNHVVDEIRKLDSPDSEPAYDTYIRLLEGVIEMIDKPRSVVASTVSPFKEELGWTDDWILTYKIISESTCEIEGNLPTVWVAYSEPGTEFPVSGVSMFRLGDFAPILTSSSVILLGTYIETDKLPVLGALKMTGNCEAIHETGCTSWELCMKEYHGDELCDEYKLNRAAASAEVMPIVYSLSPATHQTTGCDNLSMMRSMVQQRLGQDMNLYREKMHKDVLPVNKSWFAKATNLSLPEEKKAIWRNFFKTSVSVCIAIIRGLQKLHKTGIIHGDVNQGNVAFRIPRNHFANMGELELDDIRFIDLGLAKFYPLELGGDVQYSQKEILLSRELFSPWHIAGFRIGRRDDIYRAMEVLANMWTNEQLNQLLSSPEEVSRAVLKNKPSTASAKTFMGLLSSSELPKHHQNMAMHKMFGPLFSKDDKPFSCFTSSIRSKIVNLLNQIVDDIRTLPNPDSEPLYDSYINKLQSILDIANETS